MNDQFKELLQQNDLKKKGFKDWSLHDESVHVPSNISDQQPQVEMIAPDELEQIKQSAFEEAYQQGLQKAQNEIEESKNKLIGLIGLIEKPLSIIDQEVEQELINLVIYLSKNILKAELDSHPEKLNFILSDLKALFPSEHSVKTLFLNSEDYNDLETLIKSEAKDFDLSILQVDLQLARGEFKIDSQTAEIDASVESRIQELIMHTLLEN